MRQTAALLGLLWGATAWGQALGGTGGPSSAAAPAPAAAPLTAGTAAALAGPGGGASVTIPAGRVLPLELVVDRLANGLTVVVVPVAVPSLVAVQTWMAVGSRQEVVRGTTGYAHFFEHLMFHGSRELPGDKRAAMLLSLGVDENAWTSNDRTCYHLQAPADALAQLLWIESDRFKNLELDNLGVRREAGAVLGEWRRAVSDPENAVDVALYAAAFGQHGYNHPTIGLESDVLAMPDGLPTALGFRQLWYRPEHTTLVIAGDVDPAATLDLARATYESWVMPPVVAPPTPVEPIQVGQRTAGVIWTAGPANPWLAMGWKIPAFAPDQLDGAAVRVLVELLAGDVSPLYRRVVEDEQLAWSMVAPDPRSVDPGLLTLRVELRDRASGDGVDALVHAAVDAIVHPPDAAATDVLRRRVANVREQLRHADVLELGDPASWAATVGWFTSLRGDPLDFERHLAALAAVELDDVQRFAATWLVDSGRTVVRLESVAGGAQ